jgi:hypothetical protein
MHGNLGIITKKPWYYHQVLHVHLGIIIKRVHLLWDHHPLTLGSSLGGHTSHARGMHEARRVLHMCIHEILSTPLV